MLEPTTTGGSARDRTRAVTACTWAVTVKCSKSGRFRSGAWNGMFRAPAQSRQWVPLAPWGAGGEPVQVDERPLRGPSRYGRLSPARAQGSGRIQRWKVHRG